ncbi:AI-2E family transporter [Devosia aurantiaca]|uniref:AI-2E family transporter n=1 Tax=Devosia aurantiaca TaxID=2714858 RepID=A0A6M1SL88_9HYPH|nr:AI-2E family transporter [Devosia aurantiaca]NGP17306.1 AI-2E family transporter [Devosia aurantiaca]
MSTPTIQNAAFIAAIVIISAVFFWLLLPFYGAILWAVILALLFYPMHRRLTVWLRGRKSVASALSVLICVLVVVVPAIIMLATTLSAEVASLYRRIRESNLSLADLVAQAQSVLPDYVNNALNSLNLGNPREIHESLMALLASTSQTLATKAVDLGQSTLQFLVSLAIMLYLLFFLFRDGRQLAQTLRDAIPLERRRTDHIAKKFTSVVKATMRGNIVIAIVQGGLGGLTFWLLGLEAPLLWGVVMAVLSLSPAVGAFLVWGPFALYLLFTGDITKGIILILVGALVISTIDNVLRPILVGRETRLPDYVVLISTLGGLSLFGANGFVLGPLVAALFIAVWSLFTDDRLVKTNNETTPS